jgi:hypothetical protein
MPVSPRLAGLFYLLIILCGITAEVGLRMPLRENGVTGGGALSSLRLSILADLLMALADVAVAVLLFALLRSRGLWLAATASVFRLIQAAGILAGLGWLVAALGDPAQAAAYMAVHSTVYDLSLAFFAVTCAATGLLLLRGGPGWLGWALIGSGAVYGTGTVLRVIAPDLAEVFAAAYVLPLVSEVAFAIWLLLGARSLRAE